MQLSAVWQVAQLFRSERSKFTVYIVLQRLNAMTVHYLMAPTTPVGYRGSGRDILVTRVTLGVW